MKWFHRPRLPAFCLLFSELLVQVFTTKAIVPPIALAFDNEIAETVENIWPIREKSIVSKVTTVLNIDHLLTDLKSIIDLLSIVICMLKQISITIRKDFFCGGEL